jgi:HAD superfamily hydrolase (TIGR01490 family)
LYTGLSVFDLDHTLLTVNSSYRFGTYLYQKKYVSRLRLYQCLGNYVQHKFFGLPMDRLHHKIFAALFKGRSKQELGDLAEQFLTLKFSTFLYQPAIQRLLQASQAGHYTIILSSSPNFLVAPIAARLKVDEWQSTTYEQNAAGCFSHISSIMQGQEKADYVCGLAQKLGIKNDAIAVYSDSYLDLPVLKMAGKAIGVGPDSILRRICLKNGWEIL